MIIDTVSNNTLIPPEIHVNLSFTNTACMDYVIFSRRFRTAMGMPVAKKAIFKRLTPSSMARIMRLRQNGGYKWAGQHQRVVVNLW